MKYRAYSGKIVIVIAVFAAIGLVRVRSIHSGDDGHLENEIAASYDLCVVKNPYGVVLKGHYDHVPGGVTEEVVLFSQKNAECAGSSFERQGILVRYPHAKATILISHGFMCDKFDAGLLRLIFSPGLYNVMTFDFRAHGGSNNRDQVCTLGRDEAYDVIAAARFLKEHPALTQTPLIGYGFSMGAVASIQAQSKDPVFDAMILDCPFDSSERVLQHNLGNLKFSVMGYEFGIPGWNMLKPYVLHPYVQQMVKTILKTVAHIKHTNIDLQVPQFSPADSISKVKVPCFFIHCKNDETVPLDFIKNVYKGAQGYKKLWITSGRRHFDSYFYNPEKYTHKIRSFIERYLAGEFSQQSNKIKEDSNNLFVQNQQSAMQPAVTNDIK